MKDLVRVAADAGLTLHAAHLEGDTLGLYDADRRAIWFDVRLTPSERRSVVAHELGHDYFGHRCGGGPQERQADAYAAALLIDPDEYAALERFNPDVHVLAEEFGVTVDVIEDYRRYCLLPIGRAVYFRQRASRERRIA